MQSVCKIIHMTVLFSNLDGPAALAILQNQPEASIVAFAKLAWLNMIIIASGS